VIRPEFVRINLRDKRQRLKRVVLFSHNSSAQYDYEAERVTSRPGGDYKRFLSPAPSRLTIRGLLEQLASPTVHTPLYWMVVGFPVKDLNENYAVRLLGHGREHARISLKWRGKGPAPQFGEVLLTIRKRDRAITEITVPSLSGRSCTTVRLTRVPVSAKLHEDDLRRDLPRGWSETKLSPRPPKGAE
jgi:hypothetical protein